MLSSWTTI